MSGGVPCSFWDSGAWGKGYTQVAFLVNEYTLVFRRVGGLRRDYSRPYNGWIIARPELAILTPDVPSEAIEGRIDGRQSGEIAQVFVVPLYSTLALDDASYERFLLASNVLSHALRLLARVRMNDARAVETLRKRIQSLVMAAEVQAIVENRSA